MGDIDPPASPSPAEPADPDGQPDPPAADDQARPEDSSEAVAESDGGWVDA